MRNIGVGLAVCLLSMVGCGQDGDPGDVDVSQSSVTTADDVSTFYRTRLDLRRCSWPTCGGSWVSRVNEPTTRCADDKVRAECYVAEVQNSTGLSDAEWSTARGKPDIVRADMTRAAAPRS